MPQDLLPLISLTTGAIARWSATALGIVLYMRAMGVEMDAVAIPDEQAELRDGILVIFVEVPDVGRFEAAMEAHEWSWADGRN